MSGICHFLCTWGAVYGCLEIHLDFIKVLCFYIFCPPPPPPQCCAAERSQLATWRGGGGGRGGGLVWVWLCNCNWQLGKSISKNIEIQYTRVTPDRENWNWGGSKVEAKVSEKEIRHMDHELPMPTQHDISYMYIIFSFIFNFQDAPLINAAIICSHFHLCSETCLGCLIFHACLLA
jgi:hypothetical protein